MGFGTIIGVGWIIVAGSWVQSAGPLGATVAFVLGGLAIAVVALSYGEMAALFPLSGGEVVYAYEGLGVNAAYIMGWFLVLVYVAMSAFEAIAMAWILSILIPGIEGPVLYQSFGSDVTAGNLAIALSGTLLLTWVNYRGGRSSAILQNTVTWFFLAAAVLFIVAGVTGGKLENARPLFSVGQDKHYLLGFISVLATIPVWFSGFNTIAQCLGEVKDVSKAKYFYRLLLLVLLAALLFYVGVIWSTAMSAPREVLLTLDFPVAESIHIALGSRLFRDVVLVAGLLGIITSWNAMFFSGARVVFCLSRARLFSGRFAKVHERYGSPAAAVILVGAGSTLGVFAGRNAVQPLINLVSLSFSVAYLLTCLAMLRLRINKPELNRPYRVPGGYLLPVLAVLLAAILTLLAIANIWLSGNGDFPLELWILGFWGLLSLVYWNGRNAVTEQQRRELIQLR